MTKYRLHEVLGVEPDEEFMIPRYEATKFRVERDGMLMQKSIDRADPWVPVSGAVYNVAINQGILPYPPLNEETQNKLKFLCDTIRYPWMAQDQRGSVYLYEEEPRKGTNSWMSTSKLEGRYVKLSPPFTRDLESLVDWSDDKAIYVPDLLKMYNMEVAR